MPGVGHSMALGHPISGAFGSVHFFDRHFELFVAFGPWAHGVSSLPLGDVALHASETSNYINSLVSPDGRLIQTGDRLYSPHSLSWARVAPSWKRSQV